MARGPLPDVSAAAGSERPRVVWTVCAPSPSSSGGDDSGTIHPASGQPQRGPFRRPASACAPAVAGSGYVGTAMHDRCAEGCAAAQRNGLPPGALSRGQDPARVSLDPDRLAHWVVRVNPERSTTAKSANTEMWR